jgi:hypothetical protein
MATLTLKKKSATTALKAAPTPLDQRHFYFLWRFGSGRPTQRHPDLQAATTERDRLAKEYPGKTFFIFRAERIEV